MRKNLEEKKLLVREKIEKILSKCANENEFAEVVEHIRMQCFFNLILGKITESEANFIMDALDEFVEKHND